MVYRAYPAGSCGALVLWQRHVLAPSLRRFHLAAQEGETLFFVIQPHTAAQNASPAVFILEAGPLTDGVDIKIVSRLLIEVL